MAGVATPTFWLASPLPARFHVYTTLRLPNSSAYVADHYRRSGEFGLPGVVPSKH